MNASLCVKSSPKPCGSLVHSNRGGERKTIYSLRSSVPGKMSEDPAYEFNAPMCGDLEALGNLTNDDQDVEKYFGQSLSQLITFETNQQYSIF